MQRIADGGDRAAEEIETLSPRVQALHIKASGAEVMHASTRQTLQECEAMMEAAAAARRDARETPRDAPAPPPVRRTSLRIARLKGAEAKNQEVAHAIPKPPSLKSAPPPSPPKSNAPVGAAFVRPPSSPLRGDGSESGQPDVFVIERPRTADSPSRLWLPGARPGVATAPYNPADSRTEERSMRAALDNQATHMANIAVISSARTQYPAIREALLRRTAGGIEPGPLHLLPIPAVDALANAQRQQDIARAICIRSASAEVVLGSTMGHGSRPCGAAQRARIVRPSLRATY